MDDDDASGDYQHTATTPPAPTTTPAAQIPAAWELFLLFIFCCLVLLLFVRWAIRRFCGPPPEPPAHTPGKTLSRIRYGSPVSPPAEIELNLLEPNDDDPDEVDIVVRREHKIK